MTLHIRQAIHSDFESVYNFINTLEDSVFDKNKMNLIFEENCNSKQIIYLVAYTENSYIAFLSCHIQKLLHHNNSVAEIQEFFVEEDFRNQHVGKKILNFLKVELQTRGILQVEVTSNKKRINTKNFYLSNGFIHTHNKYVTILKKNP